MRIWMLEPGGRGGISQSSQYLADALRTAGEEVVFVTATDAECVTPPSDESTWQIVRWSRSRGLLRRTGVYRLMNVLMYCTALGRMYSRARRERPDVLHLQGYYVPILFWLTVRLLRRHVRAVVLTCHNAFLRSDPARGGKVAKWGVRHLIADADVVVTHASNVVGQMWSSGL